MNGKMRHYLLDPHEAELLACYRMLCDANKAAISAHIALLVPGYNAPKLDTIVELSAVSKD